MSTTTTSLPVPQSIQEVVLAAHRAVLRRVPYGLDQYAFWMSEQGVETYLTRNFKGKLIHVQFRVGGERIKASEVHPFLTASRLESTISAVG